VEGLSAPPSVVQALGGGKKHPSTHRGRNVKKGCLGTKRGQVLGKVETALPSLSKRARAEVGSSER